jgi:hypothetical protein
MIPTLKKVKRICWLLVVESELIRAAEEVEHRCMKRKKQQNCSCWNHRLGTHINDALAHFLAYIFLLETKYIKNFS